MIKRYLSILRRELKALWSVAPETLKLVKALRAEWAVYKAKKSTANFNSMMMWSEILR